MSRGSVRTDSSFCQGSGFFVQYGTETSDLAVLVIAVHSALQIFRPSRTTRGDGLYPYRYYVYVGVLLIPATMAGLAFVNPRSGYTAQGAFCTLPIRPFWYRLALAWIPRYLIAVIILVLAVAIYTHVGFEFRAFSTIHEESKPSISTTSPVSSTRDMEEIAVNIQPQIPSAIGAQGAVQRKTSSVMDEIVSSRCCSVISSSLVCTMDTIPDPAELGQRSNSLSSSRPPSSVHFPTASARSCINKANMTSIPSISPNGHDTPPRSSTPFSNVHQHMNAERARIRHQLRLLFIYPLVYILMWIIPFVNHCMMYYDKWGAHPLYWLSLLSTMCITIMGAVDCLIFSLRERPWRHIPGTNGTFLGSFMFRRGTRRGEGSASMEPDAANGLRRNLTDMEISPETPVLEPKLTGALLSSVPSPVGGGKWKKNSRSSDGHKREAGFARARLEMEKEERRTAKAEKEEKARKEEIEKRNEREGVDGG
ncbi:hypothetical protein CC78DRAFT_542954 [Lojkania enalia]|uniref:G protein-coupled glucose receptor regulating Gpa2-domain-containing protein n=1 Tax=Lojkania enalia TaxID=147567 RepID=A0A9P4KAJ9_9PLEO|nr:hypothetical protein CC78DRAFT_542954 [Didymosphaeria enalia]